MVRVTVLHGVECNYSYRGVHTYDYLTRLGIKIRIRVRFKDLDYIKVKE